VPVPEREYWTPGDEDAKLSDSNSKTQKLIDPTAARANGATSQV
jgi:hypothetical protein